MMKFLPFVTQLAECSPCKRVVMGSTPIKGLNPVVLMVRKLDFQSNRAGSIPAQGIWRVDREVMYWFAKPKSSERCKGSIPLLSAKGET